MTVSDADADDSGTYKCTATKDGKVGEDSFEVDVVMPAICEHEDGTTWEEGVVYNPQEVSYTSLDNNLDSGSYQYRMPWKERVLKQLRSNFH